MKPEILEKKVSWEGRFLRGILISYRNAKGKVIPWEAFQRVGVKGIVAVVPFTSEDDVVLTRQFRPPVGKYVIEFPAGLNDKEESLEDVARRELLEETGYLAGGMSIIAEGPLSSGASTEVLTVFLAEGVRRTGKQRLDDVEEIEVILLPASNFYKEIMELQDEETYLDLKIFGLFELARKRMRQGKG